MENKDKELASIKMMPHSIEAEQSVLGSVLLDNDAQITVFGELKEDDFYLDSHKKIFASSRKVFASGMPVDMVTLIDQLEKDGNLGKVGNITYINTLNAVVPSAANVAHYIKIVKRYSILRQLISASNKIIEKAYEATDEIKVTQMAEKEIFDIGQAGTRSGLENLTGSLPTVIERFETIEKDPASLRGLSTGFHGFDNLTNGLQKGDLIILAARPSVGKTAFALNCVVNAALHKKAKCAIFSLEMPKAQIAQRALCSVGGVSMEDALSGKMNKADWINLWQANKEIAGCDIYADDNSTISPEEILSKCRRLKAEKGLDLVMIDYIQLIKTPDGAKENRSTLVAEISRKLKIMARELDVPVIALSQLSRDVSAGGKNRKPVLSDLRESGAIEQDADIVMFLHRPDEEDLKVQNVVQLIVEKHRNGSLGTIDLKWIGKIVTFTNMPKDGKVSSGAVNAEQKVSSAKVPKNIVAIDQSGLDDVF